MIHISDYLYNMSYKYNLYHHRLFTAPSCATKKKVFKKGVEDSWVSVFLKLNNPWYIFDYLYNLTNTNRLYFLFIYPFFFKYRSWCIIDNLLHTTFYNKILEISCFQNGNLKESLLFFQINWLSNCDDDRRVLLLATVSESIGTDTLS